MDRRRFLKYAGATAAAVGASAIGLNYISQQSPSMVSPTVSTTSTARELITTGSSLNSSLSSSTETIQFASLQGRLFFDYNGNGKQDGEEPAVAGALVQLKDSAGSVVAHALTDSSGDYKLEDVRAGPCRLDAGVDHYSDKRFRYMCRSTEEFTAISEGYSVFLDRSQIIDIGLMEGFLTLPYEKGTSVKAVYYFDEDPGPGIEDWKGEKNNLGAGPGNGNGHEGTDFVFPVGTPVVAAAPGTVKYIDDWGPIGLFTIISHEKFTSPDTLSTLYAHMSKAEVSVDQEIHRGERIGLSGQDKTKPGAIHLHFELDQGFHGSPKRNSPYTPIDPYRSLWKPNAIGYWTKDNDPRCALT